METSQWISDQEKQFTKLTNLEPLRREMNVKLECKVTDKKPVQRNKHLWWTVSSGYVAKHTVAETMQ